MSNELCTYKVECKETYNWIHSYKCTALLCKNNVPFVETIIFISMNKINWNLCYRFLDFACHLSCSALTISNFSNASLYYCSISLQLVCTPYYWRWNTVIMVAVLFVISYLAEVMFLEMMFHSHVFRYFHIDIKDGINVLFGLILLY